MNLNLKRINQMIGRRLEIIIDTGLSDETHLNTGLIQLDPHLKLNLSKEFLSGVNWSKNNQVTIPFLNRFPNFQNLCVHEEKLNIH